MIRSCLLICLLSGTPFLYAQTNYTTIASGNWNDPSIWSPSPALGHPNLQDGIITVSAGHTVIIPAGLSLSLDEIIINGTFRLAPLAQITVADGPGNDLTISNSGIFIRGNLSVVDQTAATILFLAGSNYEHQYTTTEGALIDANWDKDSYINIKGYTSGSIVFSSVNWTRNLGHVVYDCAMQTGTTEMAGLLRNVKGNFIVNSTGVGALRLSTYQNSIIDLDQNLEVNGSSRIYFSMESNLTGAIINIGNDFIFKSNNTLGSYINETGICRVNVNGNFIMDAPDGLLTTSSGDGETTLNLNGNFSLHAGTIDASTSQNGKQGNMNFTGVANTMHTFNNTGAIVGDMNYIVANGNVLLMSGESSLIGGNESTLDLNGTLIVESIHPNGAIQTGNVPGSGNVGVSIRNYNAGSSIIYRNTLAQQVMGNGQPGITGAGITSILSTTVIDNSFGVSLNSTGTVTVGGNLKIAQGNLTVANNNLTIRGNLDVSDGNIFLDSSSPVVSAKTLRCDGTINLAGGKINVISGVANGDNATLTINGDITGSNYFTFSGPNCRATIGGSAPVVMSRDFPVNAPIILEQLTINRTGVTVIMPHNLIVGNTSNTTSGLTLTKGNLKMKGDLVVNVNTTLTSGTLFFEDHTIELRRAINCVTQLSPTPSGMFSSNSNSVLKLTGTYANTTLFNTLSFSASGNTLSSLELNRTSVTPLPHVTLNTLLTITNTLNLTAGGFYNQHGLTLDSAATIIRTPHALFYSGSIIPAGGPYHIQYNNGVSTSLSTGLETQGYVDNITSNLADTLQVVVPLTIHGTLNINTGVWNSGTHAISTDIFNNNAVFNAPGTTFQLTGDFINNNSFHHNNGTIVFGGNTSISGSVNSIFNNIKISGVLKSANQLDIVGHLINEGNFISNSGTVRFAGTQTQRVTGTSVTNFNNIVIANTSTPSVSLETSQNLSGILTLGVNTLLDADGLYDTATFTLISQGDAPATDGSVATLPSGAIVTGKVNVQRYVSGEGRLYRYLSSPIQNGTVADWMDDFPVTGNFRDPSAYPKWPKVICGFSLVQKNASLFYYNEIKQGASSDGYENYPKENTYAYNNNLEAGRGYAAYIRECTAPTIIDVKGYINQGVIAFPVTYTQTQADSLSAVGWNLVGNPYPSAIDWDQDGDLNNNGSTIDAVDGWTKNNIAATIAIMDNGAGVVKYWDGDNDDNLTAIPNGVIASGQGFWVRTTGANPQLIVREGVKTLQNTSFYRSMTVPAVIITLKNNLYEDKAYIKVRDMARKGLDYWDAPKLNNAVFNISTFSGDKIPMAINAIPELDCGATFKLNITGLTTGSYTIKFSNRGDFDSRMIIINDRFLKMIKKISWNEQMVFQVTDDGASKAPDRFTIQVSADLPKMVDVKYPSGFCNEKGNIVITNPEHEISYSAWSVTGDTLSSNMVSHADTLSIPFDLMIGENTIMIKGKNDCGVYDVSAPLNIGYENPKIESVKGDSSCQEGSMTLSATTSLPRATYSWYELQHTGTQLYQGQEFRTPVLINSKSYFVSATSSSGCEGERVRVDATVIKYNMPIISASGNILQSSYTDNIQWYLDDKPIDHAVEATVEAKIPGKYSVEATIQGCKVKAHYEYDDQVFTGIKSKRVNLSHYPNPVKKVLYINLPFGEKYKNAYLINSLGISLAIDPGFSDKEYVAFDLSNLPDGFYLLRFKTSKTSHISKINKIGTEIY